ncbi:hypothetical protein PV755_44500 [Streptomyces caniscabiei]|uniref:hypothetical protein n=1 Tax=Streptomyces caniscabiei TaxID=2746961 RepID=UPI0029BCEB0C|nr:hypothetical protein [Streptomyces caniscabiei]MDX3515883.1 hypothetical protein [Streptomyces caniscabiei]MDX3725063.1 hypothetical protein [Streptomyces caniscabiei]
MGAYRNTELFKATGLTVNSSTDHVTAGVTNATTGRTGAIDISRVSNGLLVAGFANAPTGTNPTVALFFDVQDAFGNWVQTSPATSIGGVVVSAAGTTYGVINNGYQMTNLGRIRWTIGGTDTPSFTGVSLSVHGRP